MNITIYLGASSGNDNTLPDAVRSLGTWIGQSGNTLVYGGSKTGLMGVLAESVIESGGEVIGVEPVFFVRNQMQYEKLSRFRQHNNQCKFHLPSTNKWLYQTVH